MGLKQSSVLTRLALAAVLVLLVLWTVSYPRRSSNSRQHVSLSSSSNAARLGGQASADAKKAECTNPDIADRVVVIVKTGATEAYAKLPTQILTALSCVPHLLFVSDMDQEIGDHLIYDVLANVTEGIRETSADFDLYRKQRKLDQQDLVYNLDALTKVKQKESSTAWNLDKYKFLHMLDKAWSLHPDKDWYVFIEADTYLVWPALLQWLGTLDPSSEHFIGSLIKLGGHRFAHGGSGFVMSNTALRKFTVDHVGAAQASDERMRNNCCGDYILSLIAKEFGIPVTGVWPMIQGGTPWTIPYGPDIWCQPVLTMHHMAPGNVELFWSFASHRQNKSLPLLFKDVYEHFLAVGLPDKRDDWDNRCSGDGFGIRDKDVDKAAISYEACEQACQAYPECFQFTYVDGDACRLYRDCFTLGIAKEAEGKKHWRSGWMKDRIRTWLDSHANCENPEWVHYSQDNGKHV